MKKITLTMLFGLFVAFSFAQTIVSTAPENKNGVLEEFTGIHCGYCPQGHAIANDIKYSNPDDFYIINIHTGSYSNPGAGEPDFRTQFGTAIANQSQLSGYPAGTISRHYFGHSQYQAPAGATALGRGTWSSDFNTLKTQSSYVNVGVEAEVDAQTNILTIHTEAYYTGDSPESTNYLNVALLQNNTKGPQSGGNQGDNYNHMHRLVYSLTGQWGEVISTTVNGTFVDRTFTYTLPSDYNGVPVEIGEMEVVVFVSETHQEIISGKGDLVAVVNGLNNDVELVEISPIIDNCSGTISPEVKIRNKGMNTLTSLDFTYDVNGEASQVYHWTGSIDSYKVSTISFPEISFTLMASNTLQVSLPSDDDVSNNSDTSAFANVPVVSDQDITIEIKPDNYGSETTWELINLSTGTTVLNGGPYSDNNSNVITANYTVNNNSCYSFVIHDVYGDGMCCTYGQGYYKVFSGSELIFQGGDFELEEVKGFEVNSVTSISDNEIFSNIRIYPNPAKSKIYISNAENFNIKIYDILGKKIFSQSNISNSIAIDTEKFNNGTYFINLSNNQIDKTQKIIILK